MIYLCYIYRRNQPNVGIHTIHELFGLLKFGSQNWGTLQFRMSFQIIHFAFVAYTYEKKYAGTFRLLCKNDIYMYNNMIIDINE